MSSLDISHPLLDSISGATGSLELLHHQHQEIRKSLLSQTEQTEEAQADLDHARDLCAENGPNNFIEQQMHIHKMGHHGTN